MLGYQKIQTLDHFQEPFLLTSGLASNVDSTVKPVLPIKLNSDFKRGSNFNETHLFYSNEADALQVRSAKRFSRDLGAHDYTDAFERICNGESAAPKVEELLDTQGWNDALSKLKSRHKQGKSVSAANLVHLLRHCTDTDDLARCQEVHVLIISSGHGINLFLHNTLVDLYSKCGSLLASCLVFSGMNTHNVFSWTAIISAHVQHEQAETAILLFGEMLETGLFPDKVLFVVILKACSNLMSPVRGWEAHSYAVEYGYDCDLHVGSTLIFMHVELGNLEYAQTVFDKLEEPSVVAWNTLIMGYAEGGFSKEAFVLFGKMQEVATPDSVTFLSMLKSCIGSEDLTEGMHVHAHAIAYGLDPHLVVGSSIVDMYAKCGSVEHAYVFFNKLEARNVVSWTAMITASAQQGMWDRTLGLFEQMLSNGAAQPNELTYASILCACSGLCLEERGREMHADVVKLGYEDDVFIGSTLIDMYANCGFLDDASFVFSGIPTPNVVTFNSMLSGYAHQGAGEEALQLYETMEKEGLRPDVATIVSILKTCSFMGALEQGREVHLLIVKYGIEPNTAVANSLVLLYSKCGSMEDSLTVFKNIPDRDVLLWNILIAGYSIHGPRQMALSLFEEMQKDGCDLDTTTFVSVIKSCASLGALKQGQLLYIQMVKIGLKSDLLLDSTVVDFFAKCGYLEDAACIFADMNKHDVVSYTAMITAYAQQGHAKDAIALFECMKQEGVIPNEVTFLGVLNACSHEGLVHDAIQYFKPMRSVYNITPNPSHCSCLIDLLGRAGHHVEAMELLSHLPPGCDDVPWLAFLGSCQSPYASEVAKETTNHLLEKSSKSATPYVLLSNISLE